MTYPVETAKKVISIKKFQTSFEPECQQDEINPTPIELIEEAKIEAKKIVRDARIQQEKVLAAIQQEKVLWEQEKVALINQAKEEGYQAGWQEGERQGFDQYTSQINEAKKVIDSAKKDYVTYLESSEKTILELSLAIASKVIATKIEGDQNYFFSLVKKAIKEVKQLADVQILVHPTNYEFIVSRKNDLLALFTNNTNLLIYPDSDLTEGSCLIESAYGRIDASIDIQLSEIKKALTECLDGVSS